MITETFAKPCVGAIIEKVIDNEKYILIQTRQKDDGNETNGMIEIPAGKIREYEDIFATLRREVSIQTSDVTTISFTPYCITQNLSGAYSIILHTFLCEAEGSLVESTNETANIHWVKISEMKQLLREHPEKIFFMHINALRKYFGE